MKFNLRTFLTVVAQVGPVILAATPGAEKFAPIVASIVGAIGAAEAIPGATGPEKKAHVLEIARATVQTLNATEKVKINAADVDEIVGTGVDNVLKTIHVLEGAKVDKTGTPAAGPAHAGPK